MANLIPTPHSEYVARVCELVGLDTRSLRDRISRGAHLSTSYATRLVEDPTIICVAGERGSGKTTVLAAAAAQLSAEGHVVIPPVRPEYFTVSRSLIPTVVAHLKTVVRGDWADTGDENSTSDINMARRIDRTLRQANLISFGGAVDSSQLRADEQAADRSLAVSADSDFLDNWRELTSQVRGTAAKRSASSKRPMLVIPVDDPDLSPGALRQILLDLRVITSVDGVVGIACLDLDEARSVLADAYMSSYHRTPNRTLTARVVEAQIAKAFPDDLRVSITGLDPDHRLKFKALDLPLAPIEKLCAKHRIGGEHKGDTVGSVLRLPKTKSPSPYAGALPSNPRDLRALAYRLSTISLDSSSSAGEAAMELCRSAIETGLKQSGATDPELWPGGMPFEILDPVEGVPSCALRFDDVSVRGEASSEREMPGSKDDDGSTSVRLGFDSGIEARLVRRGGKTETVQRLHPSLTYALLLVREFSHYYGVIHTNLYGTPPIKGGERSSSFMAVELKGNATDNRFLNPPAWEAFYDYFALDAALREVIDVAASPHGLPDRRLAIEAYFIDFCRNVVSVQLFRRPASSPARVSAAIRKGKDPTGKLDRELGRLFREIEEGLDLDDRKVGGADGVRADDFRRWVEVGIANICHDQLVSREFIERLMAHREEALIERGRLQAANNGLCATLESRVKAAIDENWVLPLIELIHELDEEIGVVLLASHRGALESVERSRRRLIGESAILNPSIAAGGARGSSDFDVALSVLDQLENEPAIAELPGSE